MFFRTALFVCSESDTFIKNFIILRISGNVGVAAFGVISVISLVVISLYTGLSQGIQPLISQNHGAENKETIQTLLNYSLITSVILSIIIYGIIFFNAPHLVSVFNSEQDILLADYAIPGLKIYFTACPFIGFNIVLSTYFISINQPLPAQIISILRSFFVLIPMAFLLSYFFGNDRCLAGISLNRNACIYLRADKKIFEILIFKK